MRACAAGGMEGRGVAGVVMRLLWLFIGAFGLVGLSNLLCKLGCGSGTYDYIFASVDVGEAGQSTSCMWILSAVCSAVELTSDRCSLSLPFGDGVFDFNFITAEA